MTLQFRSVDLLVPDVPKTVSFYHEAFGFDLRYMHPSSGYAELETGDTLLCFLGEGFVEATKLIGDVRYTPNRPDSAVAATQFVAVVTDDIESDWKRAIAAGATVAKAPEAKPWGQTAGYLRDCNGMIVELCTRSPRDPV